jgi:hypothetical protein
MEAADTDGDARGAERPGDVYRPRKLIGLDTHEANQPAASAIAYLLDYFVGPDPSVGLVPRGDADLNVFAQHPTPGAIQRKSIQRRQRIRRDGRARPLDDIALIIVVGRLDQEQMKKLFRV